MQGDVLVDKENVGPRGSAAWSQQGMVAKSRGLWGGAGYEVLRKEKSGVLASNTTTNNGGGAAGLGSLESLKERVKLLKLSNTNGAPVESGSRLAKHRSPLVDIKAKDGMIKSSVGGLASKDGTGHATAHERPSSLFQDNSSFTKLSNSRANSSEQAESNVSNLHVSGGHGGSKSYGPKAGKVLELYEGDTARWSRDRREASRSRVEAWVNGVGQRPEDTGSTSPVRFVSEEHVKASRSSETIQHQVESRTQRSHSPSISALWSGAYRQGTPYKLRPPYKLEEEKVGQITSEDEAQSNNVELRVAAGQASPVAVVSLKVSQCRELKCSESQGKEGKVGVRSSIEGEVKHFGSHSVDRVSESRRSEFFGSNLSTSGDIGSAPVETRHMGLKEKISDSEKFKLTRSSGFWGRSKAGDSVQEDSHEESTKWESSYTSMDATAVAPSSSVLPSVLTGTSSSGSSATPGIRGDSSRDDDTVAYLESSKNAPSTKEHAIPSSRERLTSRSRIRKRLKPLGVAYPNGLFLSGPQRVPVDNDGSSASKDDGSPNSVILSPDVRSSPVDKRAAISLEVASPVTPDEARECPEAVGQVDSDLQADLKKRKAEDDPSIGDVSQVGNECSTGNKSLSHKGIQSAMHLASDLHNEDRRSQLLGLLVHRPFQKAEDIGARRPNSQRGAESTDSGESQSAQRETGRTSPPDRSSDFKSSSKGVLMRVNVHDVVSASKLSDILQISEKPLSGLDSLQNPKVMVSREQGQLVDREVAQLKQPIDGAGRCSVSSSVSTSQPEQKHSPSAEARPRSAETDGIRVLYRRGSSEVKDGSEAVSMSQDGMSFRDKSETRPASVHDLSNSLGSLSIGEKDVQSKAQVRPKLQNLANTSNSSNLTVAPVNQANVLIKSLDNNGVLHNTSNSSGKSVLTSENKPQDSRSLPSERSKKELTGGSKESTMKQPKVEAGVKAAPSERFEAAESSAKHAVEDLPKEDGKGPAAVTKRKVMEDERFFWVNGKRYQKLGMIGKGGSSEVYKVIDSEFSIYALKKIKLRGLDHSTARGYYQEIEYLERLRGKRHIIQLIDFGVTHGFVFEENYAEEKIQQDACMYMVLEFGEIDLAGILSKRRKEMLESNEPLDDNWIRFYWKHMLLAVKTIHEERIVHADLKPANFLLVKGELKLIDFGIAKAIQADTTHVVRDVQRGTLNYMSPEALIENSKDEDGRVFKCGRSSDIWSLGCILYQMVYGHTPFHHVRSMYGKIQAITSKHTNIEYSPVRDPWLLDVMKKCLTWDRYHRPDIAGLLVHPFLRPDLAPQR